MGADRALTALVVYESMFGCTEAVATSVAQGLRTEGLEVRLTNVRDAAPAGTEEPDLLVVGGPTHAFSLSRPATREDAVRQGAPAEAAETGLREWLDAMGRGSGGGRLAAAFDTRVTKVRLLPKAAATRAAHKLSRKGYQLVSRPTAFLVQDVRGPLEDGELEHAQIWGCTIARAARARRSPAPATG